MAIFGGIYKSHKTLDLCLDLENAFPLYDKGPNKSYFYILKSRTSLTRKKILIQAICELVLMYSLQIPNIIIIIQPLLPA